LAEIHAPVARLIPSVALTIAFALGDLGISRDAIIASLHSRCCHRAGETRGRANSAVDRGNAMIGARSCDISNPRLLGGSPPSWAMILVAMIDFIKMRHNSTPFALLRT
jgi:hypothetical protein